MRLAGTWGRFTVRGGPSVEACVKEMVERATHVIAANIDPSTYRSMILHGGYGRGEGGVERVGFLQRPHNNLDFLMITRPFYPGDLAALKRRMDDLFRPIVTDYGVGIDTGVIREWTLRASPCLVMWYDMRFGHKTALGDATFVGSLSRFSKARIEPWDMRDLLINRGTLLVINDALLARGARSDLDRRFIVKHAMKAIIGYGDAYLFAAGRYDWSYVTRQRRMRALLSAPARLRQLYEEAMDFRFEPAYASYVGRDLGAWMAELRSELSPVHLAFERFRLNEPWLTWERYADRALRYALVESLFSSRAALRKAKNLVQGLRAGAQTFNQGALFDVATLCNGERGNRSIAFPAVLYGEGGPALAELARSLLGAESASPADLSRAYLARWGAIGDTNFATTAQKLSLTFQKTSQPTSEQMA